MDKALKQINGNIADSMFGVKERQSWRPAAMSAADSFVSDIKSRVYPFMNKAARFSEWYESFSHRVRPWQGWSPLSLEFQIDERQSEDTNPSLVNHVTESNISTLISFNQSSIAPTGNSRPSQEQRSSHAFFNPKNNFGKKPLVRYGLPYPAIELAIIRTTPDNALRYKEGNPIIKNPANNISQHFEDFLNASIPSYSSSNLSNSHTYELRLIQNSARFPRREIQSFPLIQRDSIPSRAQLNDSMESPPVRWKAMDTVTSTFRSNDVQNLQSKELVEKSLKPGNRIPVQMLQESIGIQNKKSHRIPETIEPPFTQRSKSSYATHASRHKDDETIAEHMIPVINKMSSWNEKSPTNSTVSHAVRFAEKNEIISKIEKIGAEKIHGSNPDTKGMVEKLIEHTILPGQLPGIEMRILHEKNSPKHIENEPESKRSTDEISIRTRTQENAPSIDINAVADKVYLTLLRRQQLERERRGLY